MPNRSEDRPVVLYDGVCALSNRLVQFLLKRDKHRRLRFASLQSDFVNRVFDKYETCMLPEPNQRDRFLDL